MISPKEKQLEREIETVSWIFSENTSNSPNGIRAVKYVKSKMGRFPLPPSQNGKCHWCIHPPILRLQAWSTLWDFLQVEETNSSGVGVDTTIPGDLLNYTFLVQKGKGRVECLIPWEMSTKVSWTFGSWSWSTWTTSGTTSSPQTWVSHIWNSLRSTPTCLGPVGDLWCWILKINKHQ